MSQIKIALHAAQQEIFKARRSAKYRVMVFGRRGGKTTLGRFELVYAALSYPYEVDPKTPVVCLGVLPTITEATAILWKPLKAWCEGELSPLVKKIDTQNKEIVFHGNKPTIVIRGANDADGRGLVGWKSYFLYADEFQNWRPGRYDLIRPALADTPGSKVLITGTPRGRLNALYEQFCMERVDPANYKSFHFPTLANPLSGLREQVEADQLSMPPRLWRQEYLASFEDTPGAIYEELSELNKCDRAPDSFDALIMGVDWGDVNPAIGILGIKDERWYFLEGWQGFTGQVVSQPIFDSHILRLCRKYESLSQRFLTLCDPSRPSSILHLRQIGAENGSKLCQNAIAGYNRIEEGHEQVHSLIFQRKLLFPRGIIADYKKTGVVSPGQAYDFLSEYRRQVDRLGNVLPDSVEDGVFAHCSDLIRYAISREVG